MKISAQTATIDWNDPKQNIDGFGASDAWYVDEIMQHPDKDAMIDLLFSKENGAGLSILRHRVIPDQNDWIDQAVSLSSGDLDFGDDPYHGMRFTSVTIPQGATINSAYVQFTSDKNNQTGTSTLNISGEATDDAATFTSSSGNISNRTLTAASVNWDVPNWNNSGDRTNAQKTPDISSIIQEIVNRSGWQSGNNLVIIIQNKTGKRSAITYDGNTSNCPELVIQYNSTSSFSKKITSASDDAEESGLSKLTYAAMVTQEAFNRDCELYWAASWSPPYNYKDNGSVQNGYLLKSHYQDFADHLEAYRHEIETRSGISLYGISPQNEPGKKPWESCEWNEYDFRDFVKDYLGPTLASSCKIIVPEATKWYNIDLYYDPIHNDAIARGYADIVAGHLYGGNPDDSYNHYGKPVWLTEWSYDTSPEDISIGNGLKWAHNFWRLLVNAEVSACHHWWLVNFKDKQQGLIQADKNVPGYTVAKRLWTIGNFSKFVRPGWIRIGATKTPATDVYLAAFKNPSTDDFAIVAINRSSNNKSITINFNGFTSNKVIPHRTSATQDLEQLTDITADNSFSTTLPGETITTYTGTVSSTDSTEHNHDVVINTTATAPDIDGNIESIWNNYNAHDISNMDNPGTNDLSATWKSCWDNQNLYFLTEVTDDVLINDGGNYWAEDGVEIYLDGNNSKNNTYDGIDDFQFIFNYNDATVYTGDNSLNSTTGIDFTIQPVTGGYLFEASIPWSTIGISPVADDLIGIDVHVNDDDNGSGRDHKIAWYATVDDTWKYPNLFGTGILKDLSTSIENKTQSKHPDLIYPNPFKYTISLKNKSQIISVEIYDLAGRLVYNTNHEHTDFKKLNLSSLENGTYFIKMKTIDEETIVNKIIKE
jgi:O-glycosyl hydrolase